MTGIKLEVINKELSVCKLKSADQIDTGSGFFFAARTSDEISLVCDTGSVPSDAVARSDGWKALRVTGTLDFSLVGILSGISGALAGAGIGIFAVSTYDTDYILVKKKDLPRAAAALRDAGYGI